MSLNPLASVFVPQPAITAIPSPLESMTSTITFQFNAEAEEFIPVSAHMEEKHAGTIVHMHTNVMPGLNVYADVFVPMSAGYHQQAIEAKYTEEVGGKGVTNEYHLVEEVDYSYALEASTFEQYNLGLQNDWSGESDQNPFESGFDVERAYGVPCACEECLEDQNAMSISNSFQNYDYNVSLDDRFLFMPAGEQEKTTMTQGGQECVSCVWNVTNDMAEGVPQNIDYDVEDEEVALNCGTLLDADGQRPHDIPHDGDMPTLIYSDEAQENILGGELIMHHWKQQGEQDLALWGGQLNIALAVLVNESGETYQTFPTSFQPFKFTRESMSITEKERQGVDEGYELKTTVNCSQHMPDYISVTTPETNDETGCSPTAYGQEIILWSSNSDAIGDGLSTEIDFYYPSSPNHDYCFCAGCARNALEGVWEHLGVTGENWLKLVRQCSYCGGGDLVSGTWCDLCWTCRCSACLIAKGYDTRFPVEKGIFNIHFDQKRGCLPRELWYTFFVDEVQRPELSALEEIVDQVTEDDEEETELSALEEIVDQVTEDDEEETELPARCNWLAVTAVVVGVMAMFFIAILV
ncbi:hypothetical protein EV426DRAFT_707521 [Tirmania nivea]|nr:hypothetical protein EV426DRAFT_707521 [Tirmania nivea]